MLRLPEVEMKTLRRFLRRFRLRILALAGVMTLCVSPVITADTTDTLVPVHLAIARRYAGQVREVGGNNRGPEINQWLRAVGVSPGQPWCGAFVAAMLRAAEQQTGATISPPVRSALARSYIGRRSVIEATEVRRGTRAAPIGASPVWQRGATRKGHIGFTNASWRGPTGITIEGNTSSGTRGSQADGDNVYCRHRLIDFGYFRLRWFVCYRYLYPPRQ